MAKGPKNKKFDPEVTRIILESISDRVFTVAHNPKITSFNRAAEEINGIATEEAIVRHCWDVFRSNMCEHDCALKRTMQENKPFVSKSAGDIHPRHLPSHMISGTSDTIARRTGHDPVKAAEIQVIKQTLARHRFNRKSAAAELGMHKTTLLRKIRKLGIELPAVDGRSRD